jgi:hypothetical protein
MTSTIHAAAHTLDEGLQATHRMWGSQGASTLPRHRFWGSVRQRPESSLQDVQQPGKLIATRGSINSQKRSDSPIQAGSTSRGPNIGGHSHEQGSHCQARRLRGSSIDGRPAYCGTFAVSCICMATAPAQPPQFSADIASRPQLESGMWLARDLSSKAGKVTLGEFPFAAAEFISCANFIFPDLINIDYRYHTSRSGTPVPFKIGQLRAT